MFGKCLFLSHATLLHPDSQPTAVARVGATTHQKSCSQTHPNVSRPRDPAVERDVVVFFSYGKMCVMFLLAWFCTYLCSLNHETCTCLHSVRCLKHIDEPAGKAAVIWMVGEYGDEITVKHWMHWKCFFYPF